MPHETNLDTAPSPWRTVLAAFVVGAIWAAGGLMPIGAAQADPPTVLDTLAVPTYSAMLVAFALVAWLVRGLARPNRWVSVATVVLAFGGIVAGIGNFGEDGLRIAGAEYLYGLGFFALLGGLVATAIALLVRRELVPAALVALSVAGFILAAGHGPNIVPVVWFGFAAWTLVHGRRVAEVAPRGSGVTR